MVSLKNVGSRFSIQLEVIEGGSGFIVGELSETDQGSVPSYVFSSPRHVLRTRIPTALELGMVLQTVSGDVFIVGDNGPSETARGTIWQSFRLFEATGQYTWQRRGKVIDPITKREQDTGQLQDAGNGLIWAAIESLNKPQNDREIHYAFAQARIIAGAPLQNEDIVDNRTVSQVDKQLGLSIGTLT